MWSKKKVTISYSTHTTMQWGYSDKFCLLSLSKWLCVWEGEVRVCSTIKWTTPVMTHQKPTVTEQDSNKARTPRSRHQNTHASAINTRPPKVYSDEKPELGQASVPRRHLYMVRHMLVSSSFGGMPSQFTELWTKLTLGGYELRSLSVLSFPPTLSRVESGHTCETPAR